MALAEAMGPKGDTKSPGWFPLHRQWAGLPGKGVPHYRHGRGQTRTVGSRPMPVAMAPTGCCAGFASRGCFRMLPPIQRYR